MSHTTVVKTMVKNLNELKAALSVLAEERGFQYKLLENEIPQMFFNNQYNEKCELVIRIEGCRFEVGFKYNEQKKGYEAVLDTFAGAVKRYLGTDKTSLEHTEGENALGRLMHLYAYRVVNNKINQRRMRRLQDEEVDGVRQLIVA